MVDCSLVKLLPNLFDLQLNARAPSTARKYQSYWLKWRTWASSKCGVSVLPADPLHVALFLTDLAYVAVEKGTGISSLDAVTYSIAWVHKLAGLEVRPTEHPLVKSTLEGAKRMLAKPASIRCSNLYRWS